MSETVMGESLSGVGVTVKDDTFSNYAYSYISKSIKHNILKEMKRQERKKIGIFCSYNLAMVLFFYDIDKELICNRYYEKVISNSDDPDTFIPSSSNMDKYFPMFTIHEAKYFLRTCMNIDIVEYPVMHNKTKMYAADIWFNGKLIKHKKWAYMFYKTPEEAFEDAAFYILLDKELNRIKKPAVMIGKKEWYGTTYTLYVNNLDRYYHMIEYTKVEELKEIYDLPINKYKNKL